MGLGWAHPTKTRKVPLRWGKWAGRSQRGARRGSAVTGRPVGTRTPHPTSATQQMFLSRESHPRPPGVNSANKRLLVLGDAVQSPEWGLLSTEKLTFQLGGRKMCAQGQPGCGNSRISFF